MAYVLHTAPPVSCAIGPMATAPGWNYGAPPEYYEEGRRRDIVRKLGHIETPSCLDLADEFNLHITSGIGCSFQCRFGILETSPLLNSAKAQEDDGLSIFCGTPGSGYKYTVFSYNTSVDVNDLSTVCKRMLYTVMHIPYVYMCLQSVTFCYIRVFFSDFL